MAIENLSNLKIKTLEQAVAIIQVLVRELNTLTTEVKQLRVENTQLRVEGAQLREENTLLKKRIQELEEKLRTNSQNSSKPPSQDPFRRQKKKRKKKSIDPKSIINPKVGRVGKTRTPVTPDQLDKVYDCPPERKCCSCGGDVSIHPHHFRRKQQFELPEIKPIITEYRLFRGKCLSCDQIHYGSLPEGVPPGLLGPRALTFAAEMIGKYHLSRRELKLFLEKSFSIPLSLGSLSHCEELMVEVLKDAVEEAKQYIRGQDVVHMDETGHKESGKKQWMWVAVTQWVTVFSIHVSRGSVVAKELLGECFAGILVSDRYSAYTWLDPYRRQFCWAHLIRDFIRIAERSGTAERVGMEILAYTKRIFSLWHRVRDGTLCQDQFQTAMGPIREAIEKLLTKGSQEADKKTQATCKNLLKLKAALWTFVEHEAVEPTNNIAERSLRPYVIWRKKSFGSQSKRGNHFIEVMMTVVASCRQQKLDFSEFIFSSLQAHLKKTVKPSLLPHD